MKNTKIIEWLLRVGLAGTFIGHGAFALLGKEKWLTWIMDFTGMDAVSATTALFSVGVQDVVIGIIILIIPIRIVLIYAVIWTSWTAFMHILPVIGDPIWELFEKIVIPMVATALLVLRGWPQTLKDWFR